MQGRPRPASLLFRDRHEFRSFHDGEGSSFSVIAGLYAVAFSAIALVWLVSRDGFDVADIPILVAAFVAIGWAQYSIGKGMHEAVHHNLCNKKSDWLAWAITAYPIGLFNDRDYHLSHHRYLGTEQDPHYPEYTSFPKSKIALAGRLLWFVSGMPGVKQFVEQKLRAQANAQGPQRYADAATLISIRVVLLSLFWWAFGSPFYYVVFWVVPIATTGKLLSTTRPLCEHGSTDKTWVVRTIEGPRWQTWLMGAFDFNFHGEHHLFPSIPYAQLQRLRNLHRDYIRDHPDHRPFDGRFEVFSGGYAALETSNQKMVARRSSK